MYNPETALALVKARLDRLQGDTTLDEYLSVRIEAAAHELAGKGITISDSTDDLVLLVDYTVYMHHSRDQQNGMPEWLRLRIRERWLQERRRAENALE